MAPHNLLHPLSSICFEGKIYFSACQDLSYARSKYFKLPESESRDDVWSIKPPDFSLKLYRTLSDPQKKHRKINSKLTVPKSSKTKVKTGIYLPSVSHEINRKDPPKFITSYKPPDAQESELVFVRTGKYSSERYMNPKPHNFRPLDETLPDIVTTYERDPGNLKLRLKHLDTLWTTATKPDFTLRKKNTRIDTHKPPEPQWDARLVLPQLPWPPKSASYTRHQRRRGAHSAFLDRVEDKLSRSWENRP